MATKTLQNQIIKETFAKTAGPKLFGSEEDSGRSYRHTHTHTHRHGLTINYIGTRANARRPVAYVGKVKVLW